MKRPCRHSMIQVPASGRLQETSPVVVVVMARGRRLRTRDAQEHRWGTYGRVGAHGMGREAWTCSMIPGCNLERVGTLEAQGYFMKLVEGQSGEMGCQAVQPPPYTTLMVIGWPATRAR